MASIEPQLHGLARTPLARIGTDLPKFDDARISTDNVQQDPQMHGIVWIPCSCLAIFTWVHVTALRAQRLTELYYGIILRNYITKLYYGIVLLDNITELYHLTILRDNITEYHGIILRKYITAS